MVGQRPYDSRISATENSVANAWTFGEGYHNFHHVFPLDYKGSEFDGYEYFNISAKLIQLFEGCGWVHDLKTTPSDIIASRVLRTGDGSYHNNRKH